MNQSTASTPAEMLLALGVVWTLAVAKPLLDVLSRAPEYWTANRVDPPLLLGVVCALGLLPPLILGGALALLRRFESLRLTGNVLFILTFTSLAALSAYHGASLVVGKGLAAGAFGITIALLASWSFARFGTFRSYLGYCSVVTLAAPAIFLLAGPTSQLILGEAQRSGKQVTLASPVIILVFDELSTAPLLDSEGKIDAHLYPNFARLAARSTWFRNATANYGATQRSIPSLLTGKLQPGDTASTAYYQQPENLFTLLRAPDGVFAIEPVTRMCPPDICFELKPPLRTTLSELSSDAWLIYQNVMVPDQFRSLVPPIPLRFHDLAGSGTSAEPAAGGTDPASPLFARFDERIATRDFDAWLRKSGPRSLAFLHFELPHVPYVWNYDETKYIGTRSELMLGWDRDPDFWKSDADFYTAQALQRYMLQMMYVDTVLGRMLDSLETSGKLDSATIVVTADHGASFSRGHARRAATFEKAQPVFGEVVAIPLFWKEPHQSEAARTRRNVELIDVLPTLLAQRGMEPPGSMDGRSLFDGQPRVNKTYADHRYELDVWPDVVAASRRLRALVELPRPESGSRFVRPRNYSSLIGREVGVAKGSVGSVRLANPMLLDMLESPEPGDTHRPNFVEGYFDRDEGIKAVAVAIDGRIADLVDVERDEKGRPAFSALFDPRLLSSTGNRLSLYGARVTAGGVVELTPVEILDERYQLLDGRLVDGSGAPMLHDQHRLMGSLDTLEMPAPGILHACGWLGDRQTKRPVKAFMLTHRDQRVVSHPNSVREDLKFLGEGFVRSGFDIEFVVRTKTFAPGDVRLYAIFDDHTYAEIPRRNFPRQ